ncbi:molybdenum cofactor guanylyltransferase [Sphingosinicella sp. CPCC 101087]|uniref:molybdenum cofactor guanylyltransferase n=1 Tax=Sphingosinicella sp. CPCC 101087 TaxID=2497754 RepID=UPI00101BBDBE|nr:molybdenum cofactor guanylyltransferase [Sphingosinicella sp. CPCC 101087]
MISGIAVLVLAGGEGSRIGGGKPLRRLGADTLVARALSLARRWSDQVLVAVREPEQVQGIDAELVRDDPGLSGPLGGLAAGLRQARLSRRDALLAIPCDTPFLPADLLERLAQSIGGAKVAVAASAGRLHPSCALWRVEALDALPDWQASGRRSLIGFADAAGHVVVEWPVVPFDPFFNVNSEADLRRAEAILAG